MLFRTAIIYRDSFAARWRLAVCPTPNLGGMTLWRWQGMLKIDWKAKLTDMETGEPIKEGPEKKDLTLETMVRRALNITYVDQKGQPVSTAQTPEQFLDARDIILVSKNGGNISETQAKIVREAIAKYPASPWIVMECLALLKGEPEPKAAA